MRSFICVALWCRILIKLLIIANANQTSLQSFSNAFDDSYCQLGFLILPNFFRSSFNYSPFLIAFLFFGNRVPGPVAGLVLGMIA